MAYVTPKLQDNTNQQPINQGNGSIVNLSQSPTNVSGGGQYTPGQSSQTHPQYVSGSQYLDANKQQVNKLASDVIAPIAQQTNQVTNTIAGNINDTLNNVNAFDNTTGAINQATHNASTLTPQQQDNIKQLMNNKYMGNSTINYTNVNPQQQQIAAETKNLQSVGGVEQQLSTVANPNSRYTPGMRKLDAELLRQSNVAKQAFTNQQQLNQNILNAKAQGLKRVNQAVTNNLNKRVTYAKSTLTNAEKKVQGAVGAETIQRNNEIAKINNHIKNNEPLSANQLIVAGLTAQNYDMYRRAHSPASWGWNTSPYMAGGNNVNNISPSSYNVQNMNNYHMNNQNAQNVMTPDQLLQYNALLGISHDPRNSAVPNAVISPTHNLNAQFTQGYNAINQANVVKPTNTSNTPSYADITRVGWGPSSSAPHNINGNPNLVNYNPSTGKYQTVWNGTPHGHQPFTFTYNHNVLNAARQKGYDTNSGGATDYVAAK